MDSKRDIFDKIMSLPILKCFYPFYKMHKELLLYLFFGGASFIVSVGSYTYFDLSLNLNELIANFWSWILALLFAYITNKIWFFNIRTITIALLLKEIIKFFTGRLATLLVEECILYIFITKLDFGSIAVKIFAQIVVIILNYIISKVIVFKEK